MTEVTPAGKGDPRTRYATGIFLFYLAIYGLLAPGHLELQDAWSVLETARSLYVFDTFEIDFDPGFGGRFHEGRFYSQYGLGAVLLALPAAVAGHHLSAAASGALGKVLMGFPFSFMNSFWSALVVALFFVAAARRVSLRSAATASHLLALTTLIAAYSHGDSVEPSMAALLMAGYVLLDSASAFEAAGGGACLGLAFLCKVTAGLAWPAMAVFAWVRAASTGGAWARVRFLAAASLGPLIGLALVLLYNHHRFGDPLVTGYSAEVQSVRIPLWIGLYGLLFSSGKGLFWFCPLLMALPFTAGAVAPALPRETRLAGGLFLPFLFFHAVLQNWDGDPAFGPRYLVPVVPFLFLLLLPVFESARGLARAALIGLAALGVVVQASAILVSHKEVFLYLSAQKIILGDPLMKPSKPYVAFHPHIFNPDLHPVRVHYHLLGNHLRNGRGLAMRGLPLPSGLEEENDAQGHRLTPMIELPPAAEYGEPDLWMVQGLPFASTHPPLYFVPLLLLGISLIKGRREMRAGLRLERLATSDHESETREAPPE